MWVLRNLETRKKYNNFLGDDIFQHNAQEQPFLSFVFFLITSFALPYLVMRKRAKTMLFVPCLKNKPHLIIEALALAGKVP